MADTAKNVPRITAEEYFKLTADREDRTELLDGEIVALAAPGTQHQRLVRELSYAIHTFIRTNGGPCEVFTSPYDVVIDEKNVVQPDVLIVCDPSKIDEHRCNGAPDLVVEVTSTNWKDDYREKMELYRKHGVREYWIVDTDRRKVWVYLFEQHPNVVNFYDWTDTIPVGIYGGKLSIRIADLV